MNTDFSDHSRSFSDFRYVYPVVSRRSGGLSIGIDLTASGLCSFRCVYCQIDRTVLPSKAPSLDPDLLAVELETLLSAIRSGDFFENTRFGSLPEERRAVQDIALSGSGEPTASPVFQEVVEIAAAAAQKFETKLVLITNATQLRETRVANALQLFRPNYDEIWAKLDAGTEAWFKKMCSPQLGVTFEKVLTNLRLAAEQHPLVIQTMLLRFDDEEISEQEIAAYIEQLREIDAKANRIRQVQLYSVARTPADKRVTHVPPERLEVIAQQVRDATGLKVSVFP